MAQGFVYLVAVMDWFSRFVLSWSLSLTMEVEFCVEALKRALRRGRPEIFNSDQGSQFTSEKFTGELARRRIAISMDGRGRCLDNIFVERLWRSLKYEEVYLKDYASVCGGAGGHRRLLPVLQPRAAAPEPRLPDAGGDLFAVRETKIDRAMGASGGRRAMGASGGRRAMGASGGRRAMGASGGRCAMGASSGKRAMGRERPRRVFFPSLSKDILGKVGAVSRVRFAAQKTARP